jgi:hypothetical protein
MFRYRLRTLLIVLALGPPVIAFVWIIVTIHVESGPKEYLDRTDPLTNRAVSRRQGPAIDDRP